MHTQRKNRNIPKHHSAPHTPAVQPALVPAKQKP